MKKIKLLIFPGFFLPHCGGLESHVDNFVKYMSQEYEDYDITIFVPNIPTSKEKETIHNNVKVIRYPAFEAVFNFPVPKFWTIRFWKLYLGLYKTNYDIVMTRTLFFMNSTLGMVFSKFRLKPTKLIHVEHGSGFTKTDSKFKDFINKFYILTLGKMLVRMSDKVIGVSNGSKKYLINDILNKKPLKNEIEVIRRGFNYEQFENIKPLGLLKSENIIMNPYRNKKVICFVGRLIAGKGVDKILELLKEISTKDYIFLIIGDGEEKDNLFKLVKKYDLLNNVKFLGRLPYEEVISILKISDIFINLSYSEGLPTTVLEAYFSNCDIMASNVGGTKEILDDLWKKQRYNLVEVKDNSWNAVKLNNMINSIKVNKQLVESEVKDIKEKFNWYNHVKKYNKIIKKVLK